MACSEIKREVFLDAHYELYNADRNTSIQLLGGERQRRRDAKVWWLGREFWEEGTQLVFVAKFWRSWCASLQSNLGTILTAMRVATGLPTHDHVSAIDEPIQDLSDEIGFAVAILV